MIRSLGPRHRGARPHPEHGRGGAGHLAAGRGAGHPRAPRDLTGAARRLERRWCMPFDALTPDIACEALTKAGLQFTPAQVRVEARDERWVVHLPGRRMAWFPASDEGLRRLKRERRVLRVLEARCAFGAPRVLVEDPAGEFDVRAMVPGAADPWRVYAEVCDDAELAARLGAAVGAILAEQHTRIGASGRGRLAASTPELAGTTAMGSRATAEGRRGPETDRRRRRGHARV